MIELSTPGGKAKLDISIPFLYTCSNKKRGDTMKTTICTFCHQPINGKPGQILLNPLEYSHKVDAGIMHSLTTFVIRRYSHASLKEVLSNRLMLRLCPQTRFAKVVNFALCMYRDAEFASTMCADDKANQAEVREILHNINSPNVRV